MLSGYNATSNSDIKEQAAEVLGKLLEYEDSLKKDITEEKNKKTVPKIKKKPKVWLSRCLYIYSKSLFIDETSFYCTYIMLDAVQPSSVFHFNTHGVDFLFQFFNQKHQRNLKFEQTTASFT